MSIESYINTLTTALETLTPHLPSSKSLILPPSAPPEAHAAHQTILNTLTHLLTLLSTPSSLLHNLTTHTQLLASLHWLGEFQILAAIPLTGSVPITDIADLTGIPAPHLTRIIRTTATIAGFLSEPIKGHVAHTPLSGQFVTRPAYLDAAMFLSGAVAPAALQMANATQRFGEGGRAGETAYNLAMNNIMAFPGAVDQRPRLGREWNAFWRYAVGDEDIHSQTELLVRCGLLRRKGIYVVEVGAQSTERALALATLCPTLEIVVQLPAPTPTPIPYPNHDHPGKVKNNKGNNQEKGIKITHRLPGSPQPITNASLYVLHLPSPSPVTTLATLAARIIAEFRVHLDILRSNPGASLLLTPSLLPGSGSSGDVENEGKVRVRDLVLWQLGNERELEMGELVNMLGSVGDTLGRLVVVNEARDERGVVLEVKYRSFS